MNVTNPVARVKSREPKVLAAIKASEDVVSTPSMFSHAKSDPPGYMIILTFSTNVVEWCQKMSNTTGVHVAPVSGSTGEKFSLA